MPRKKKIRIPMELILAALFLIIIVGLLFIFLSQTTAEEISNEVCDNIDNDGDGEIDEGFYVTCRKDADCGEDGTYGETFCKDGDVWQGYIVNVCQAEVGTCASECLMEQTTTRIKRCGDGCRAGSCL